MTIARSPDGLLRLLDDAQKAAHLAVAARCRTLDRYSTARMAEATHLGCGV